MALTPAGTELFDVLRSGLSRLETTVSDLRERAGSRKFTIAAAPGFLSFWLLPRFPALRDAFPEIDFSFLTGDYGGASVAADVHVRFGDGQWDGIVARKVVGEEVFPVCAPVYLNGRAAPLPEEEILNSQLLQLADSYQRWYDWPSWMAAAGVVAKKKPATIDFDSYAMVINAALSGQGIALCWVGLLEQFLETGALVRVSDRTLTTDRGYFVTYDPRFGAGSTTALVADWLFKEASGAGST